MLSQPFLVLFAPLGGGRHRKLFSVPAGEEDGPPRPPARALKIAECPRELDERGRSAAWIDAAINPGITVVADDHDIVWLFAAADCRCHSPDRPDAVVRPDFEAHDCRSGAGAARDVLLVPPRRRHFRAFERVENHARIFEGQWSADYPWQRHRVARREPPRPGRRCPSRSQRVAGRKEVVGDPTALDATLRPPGAIRIGLALLAAIEGRIAVHENAGSAAHFCRQRLEAAIAIGHRVVHEHDFSAHVDALRVQPVVVGRLTVAGEDDGSCDVTRRRVCMVGNSRIRVRRLRVGIGGCWFFAHRRAPRSRRSHLHRDLLWPRQQDLVRRDLGISQAGPTKLVASPLGQLSIAFRSRGMRLSGEQAMRVANGIGGRKREEATLELPLRRLRYRR